MTNLNDNTTYTCFTILGKAGSMENRFFAKNQWMESFGLLNDFFAGNELNASLRSFQDMWRIKKIDKKRGWSVTGKAIATGGVQAWSERANLKVCTKEMDAHIDLIRKASDLNQTWYGHIEEQFPAINTYYAFDSHIVRAYLDSGVNIKHEQQGDFHFFIRNARIENENWDQELTLLISERLVEKAAKTLPKLISDLARIAHSVQTGKATFLYGKTTEDSTRSIINNRFGQPHSLELKSGDELQLSEWETL